MIDNLISLFVIIVVIGLIGVIPVGLSILVGMAIYSIVSWLNNRKK